MITIGHHGTPLLCFICLVCNRGRMLEVDGKGHAYMDLMTFIFMYIQVFYGLILIIMCIDSRERVKGERPPRLRMSGLLVALA